MTFHCPKCHGFLSPDRAWDLWDNKESIVMQKCINCGWRGDPVVQANALKTDEEKTFTRPKWSRKPHRNRMVRR